MPHAACNVSSWRVATADEASSFLRLLAPGSAMRHLVTNWWNDGLLSPLDTYAYLRVRFGLPNGPAMALRDQSVSNLVHWEYWLMAGTSLLMITGYSFQMKLAVAGDPGFDKNEWTALAKQLKKDIHQLGPALESMKSSFERWSLVVNPYFRITDVVRRRTRQLNRINLNAIHVPPRPVHRREAASRSHAMTKAMRAYGRAAELSLSIRMLAPVMGEAFVNLLLLTLLRPDLRRDKVVLNSRLREQIDVRVKMLHVHCLGFIRPLTDDSPEVAEFLGLMRDRNQQLHGSIQFDRKDLEEIYFDQKFIPLFKTERSMSEFALRSAIHQLEPDKAIAAVNVVDSFVRHALTCLQDQYCQAIEMFMRTEQLGYRPDVRMFGTVLPEPLAEAYFMQETDGSGDETAG